jgi:hypothetical protein
MTNAEHAPILSPINMVILWMKEIFVRVGKKIDKRCVCTNFGNTTYKEQIYDEKINPLMSQIIKICQFAKKTTFKSWQVLL